MGGGRREPSPEAGGACRQAVCAKLGGWSRRCRSKVAEVRWRVGVMPRRVCLVLRAAGATEGGARAPGPPDCDGHGGAEPLTLPVPAVVQLLSSTTFPAAYSRGAISGDRRLALENSLGMREKPSPFSPRRNCTREQVVHLEPCSTDLKETTLLSCLS